MAPKVSVVMATYNHGPYVAQAIRSVLDQSFADFEFLISDDGSQDDTRDVVGGFIDPRMRFFPNTRNRGACVVTNELIERAQGEYVAILNSDDYWVPDKLAYQAGFMDRHAEYAAMFGRPSFVDAVGAPVSKLRLPFGDVFDQDNRPSGRWLRRFFEHGNCLCHPSILIRRACYADVGLYDNRYRQLPDMDMWIRLCKKYRLFVSDRKLVFFRILAGENVSSQTRSNSVRSINEHYLIAETFFDGVTTEMLVDGFEDMLVFDRPPSAEHAEIEKTLLYFAPNRWLGHVYQIIGLSRLFRLLGSPIYRPILISEYGIDDLSFQRLAAEADAFRPAADLRGASGFELIQELKSRVMRRLRR